MYSTCIFCARDLGRNEVLETFPVGRRLAYDAMRGRLWVVCPRCERWNLTPLEDRWEAIEQSERLFRQAARRISTEQIGLARLRAGTELVRVGKPLRPEYAAWRYGDRFHGRHSRRVALAATRAAEFRRHGAAWCVFAGSTFAKPACSRERARRWPSTSGSAAGAGGSRVVKRCAWLRS